MTDATARIRNLSIALERLSRKGNVRNLEKRVFALLSHEITKEEENQRPPLVRPTEPPVDDESPF